MKWEDKGILIAIKKFGETYPSPATKNGFYEKMKNIVNEYLTDINKLIDMALQENVFIKNVVKGIYEESSGLVKIIV